MANTDSKKSKFVVPSVAAAIIAAVLAVEGGYTNDPRDPGGATNHGVTEKVARANGYTGPMETMPKEVAERIYYDSYIKAPGFDLLMDISPAVTEELADAGVNVGPSRPQRWIRASLNSLNRNGQDFPQIKVDGKVDAEVVAAYQGLVKKRGKVKACELTLKLLDAQQANYYMSLTNLKVYTPGWIDHRIGNVNLTRCKE